MAKIRRLPRGSLVRGPLPQGCVLCEKGAKLVLLVTGKCAAGCYYCPLSSEKAGRDVIFADELRVRRTADIFLEARLIDAEGTGITGGDPLCAPARTLRFIRALKRRFGRGHHIHLYTSGRFPARLLGRLSGAGLDEIRFHPEPSTWARFEGTKTAALMREALGTGMAVGAEVPAIPGRENELALLSGSLDRLGAGFLNLNELEYSETNFRRLNAQGFSVRDDLSAGVLGSEAAARQVAAAFDGEMTVHYCSSGFKDGVQLRRRIMRRARNVVRPFEAITPDGTLVKGIIEGPPSVLLRLRREHGVPAALSVYDRKRRRSELSTRDAERVAGAFPGKAFIVEVYPTADALEVERTPL
jgi:uncharacterized protein